MELLEGVAPVSLAEPWDNPGLQVGEFSEEISKIFLSLDPTLSSLQRAANKGAQLLLTHHPLIFKPVTRLEIDRYPGNVIAEAIKRGISIVAAHTNLDVAQGGMNDMLAEAFGLKRVDILDVKDRDSGTGLGRVGYLPEPTELSALVTEVKSILGSEGIKVVDGGKNRIHRLAVVAGSGGGMASIAAKQGADLLLTGDVTHHHAMEAESIGISMIDAGHFSTENTAFNIFAGYLRKAVQDCGWDVAVLVDEDETDPMKYM